MGSNYNRSLEDCYRLEKIPGLPEIPRSIHIGLLFSPR